MPQPACDAAYTGTGATMADQGGGAPWAAHLPGSQVNFTVEVISPAVTSLPFSPNNASLVMDPLLKDIALISMKYV